MDEKQRMKMNKFIEEVFEIAFGEDAINKDYSEEEVLKKLKEYAEESYKFECGYYILMDYWDSLPDSEKEHIDKQLKELGL